MSVNPVIPQALHVSGSSIIQAAESDESVLDDPRGLLLMWEPPLSWAHYIMGADPSVGITGWHRGARRKEDQKTDNSAIEIFRVDAIRMLLTKDGMPDIDPITKQQRYVYRDLQVAEYAAPIDAVEMGRVCNLLGRIYAGDAEDQCELIYESYPGPGVLTTQELLRLGYANLWTWEYIDSIAEDTNKIGWRSSAQTQKMLWFRARRHLMERRVKIQSPFLVAEYANAVIDMDRMRAQADYGFHDDRFQAANMCYWAGHKWAYDVERTAEPVTEQAVSEPQRYAPVLGGEHRSYRDVWADVVDSWS